MSIRSVSVAPEYNSFYVAGSLDVDVPIKWGAVGVFGTEECLVVPCLYWNDGDTMITLGHSVDISVQTMPRLFDGLLKTPQRRVLLFDVHMPEIMSMTVAGEETRIRIWANHISEPDKITIGVD